MVKTITIIRRIGNKHNDLKHFMQILPLDVETVVEPFGGSFAVIKFFYKDINKYKFHINDLDTNLFYIYKHFEDYLEALNIIQETYEKMEGYTYDKAITLKKFINELNINDIIKEYIKNNFIIRGSMFKWLKSRNYDENEKQILINSLITNEDYINIFNQYKDDDKAFLFIDPPYLFSDNSGYVPQNIEYKHKDKDMTSIILNILELLKTSKCKVMLIINKLDILEYLFKDFIKGEYSKIYCLSKKKNKHLIITNY